MNLHSAWSSGAVNVTLLRCSDAFWWGSLVRVHVYEYVLAVQGQRILDTTRHSMRSKDPVRQWIRLCCLDTCVDAGRVCKLESSQVRTVLFALTPEYRSAQHNRCSIALLDTHLRGSAHIHTQQEEWCHQA